ncbi:hypothetical protein [Methanosarcina spelaei]|uniref:hypothetical protein n=1 Tax=Methanosarcina spelaei TaxID=1036679 RepID=UPI001FE251E4|nr:hypothetical protein [Methanosarcina spelaei]
MRSKSVSLALSIRFLRMADSAFLYAFSFMYSLLALSFSRCIRLICDAIARISSLEWGKGSFWM